MMKQRIIYQVAEKKSAPDGYGTPWQYRFRIAFDLEHPMGVNLDMVGFMTLREMRRLTLLDLATLRLHFDNFIREWARMMGEPDPDDVR